ncbi:MAG: hypothetical protein QXG03_08845 [Halalkalicoccus sp.]
MALAHAERRIERAEQQVFGRRFVPFERIALGILGPLAVAAHLALALATLAFVYALAVPLL